MKKYLALIVICSTLCIFTVQLLAHSEQEEIEVSKKPIKPQWAPCFVTVENWFPDSDNGTILIDGEYYYIPGNGGVITVDIYKPTTLYIWECIWNDDAEDWDCKWDPYPICPDGYYLIEQQGDWANQTLVTVKGGDCWYGITVSPPASPYQSVFPSENDLNIELRNENLPQGLHLYFDDYPMCSCWGDPPQKIELIPRSGTGPVFNVIGNQTYFMIDNLTATGYYDIKLTCQDQSEMIIPANINFVGYQGYTPSGTIVNEVTGNTIRGAGVSIWASDGAGGFDLYESTVAFDGTYFFDVPPGTYRILVEYDLNGEYWTDPFTVNSPIPDNIVPPLEPISDDTDPPIFHLREIDATNSEVTIVDDGVGLAVVEINPSTFYNTVNSIEEFEQGEDSVKVDVCSEDGSANGYVQIVAIDLLGNHSDYTVILDETATLITIFEARSIHEGIELEWDLESDDQIEEIYIERRDQDSRTWNKITNGELVSSESGRFTDRNVTAGRSYEYVLTVLTKEGEAIKSRTVHVNIKRYQLSLQQNYPNPFNPATSISFTLPERMKIDLSIYDINGKRIKTLSRGVFNSGHSEINWNGTNEAGVHVSSGVYFAKLKAGNRVLSKKMVLLR